MTDTVTSIESLFEKAQDYGATSLELLKLNAISKTSDVTSTLLSQLIIFMVVALSVMIISIGVALWISEVLGHTWYGFFIVGGFYLLIGVLLYFFKDQWLKSPLHNAILEKIQK
jgi:phosphoglycerol transferase MdoB-like AlkP superfamily enzyme